MDARVAGTLVTLIALAFLLIAEKLGSKLGIWIAKPTAALGYLALALASGALETPYGVLILVGLALSFWGDVFLIPDDSPRIFQAGILSFLLGHVAFTIAFWRSGVDYAVSALAAGVLIAVAAAVLRWLMPNVGDDMRAPVKAYVGVISLMLVVAAGCAVKGGRPEIFAGAFLFYLSDLSVARNRFVSPGFVNTAWGLPCYFLAQLILAASVAGA
jgi:uncharacterized membrane protein YhhN